MNQEDTNQKDFLTLAEAADYIRSSIDSLRGEVANRRVPFISRPNGPIFARSSLKKFLLSKENQPYPEEPSKDAASESRTTLLKRLVDHSGLIPDYKNKYVNLRTHRGRGRGRGRVLAQFHQNPCGVHLAIPEGSDDEAVPQSPLQPVDIEELSGYSIGPEKSWLNGDGKRGTYRKAIAFHIPDSIGDDSDAWAHIMALIEYAKK